MDALWEKITTGNYLIFNPFINLLILFLFLIFIMANLYILPEAVVLSTFDQSEKKHSSFVFINSLYAAFVFKFAFMM